MWKHFKWPIRDSAFYKRDPDAAKMKCIELLNKENFFIEFFFMCLNNQTSTPLSQQIRWFSGMTGDMQVVTSTSTEYKYWFRKLAVNILILSHTFYLSVRVELSYQKQPFLHKCGLRLVLLRFKATLQAHIKKHDFIWLCVPKKIGMLGNHISFFFLD